jgi:hypothetical protein
VINSSWLEQWREDPYLSSKQTKLTVFMQLQRHYSFRSESTSTKGPGKYDFIPCYTGHGYVPEP